MSGKPQDVQAWDRQSASSRSNDDRGGDLKSNAPAASSLQQTTAGSRDEQPGKIVRGRRNGRGTIHFDNGDVYEGELNDGNMHGKGICRYADGRVYDGAWMDGQPHGRGLAINATGDVCKADFTDGVEQGWGATMYANGAEYRGEFKGGLKHGKGFYRIASGGVYDGVWKDDKPHGAGTKTWANGDVYEGSFVDGMRHGEGVQRYPEVIPSAIGVKGGVTVYDGEWENDVQHGTGTFEWANGCRYEGQLRNGKLHGKGVFRDENGDAYDGEWEEGMHHGNGTFTWTNGNVYGGEWKDNKTHGRGIKIWANGDVYMGGYKDGLEYGAGTKSCANGDVYVGEWVEGRGCVKGTIKRENGSVYEGESMQGKEYGWGTLTYANGNVYEGQWVGGKEHGRGTFKWKNGDVFEGDWEDGKKTRGKMKWANGGTQTVRFPPDCNERGADAGAGTLDVAPEPSREIPNGRKMRSRRSQQQRLQTTKKCCEQCGASDETYKLRVCSACNLALYCSVACQKVARKSHQRICNAISHLPPRDDDRLVLEFDKDKMVDLDAGLQYATKYMSNLKHVKIDFKKMLRDEDGGDKWEVELSSEMLRSLFKSKGGALDSFVWDSKSRITNGDPRCGGNCDIWKELHDLKQLRLRLMHFESIQRLYDLIVQQKNTLEVLCLPELTIDWGRDNGRKMIALAISFCKNLVKLDLEQCVLLNDDLEIMLYDLPNLRCLNLERHQDDDYGFSGITDETCEIIARKCPNLQDVNLKGHMYLSVVGIKKIFEGCIHLRSFCTTTRNLSEEDIRGLLDIAPQLLCLAMDVAVFSRNRDPEEIKPRMREIIDATDGRTLFSREDRVDRVLDPRESLSIKANYLTYGRQIEAYREIWSKRDDPEIANEWEELFDAKP